LAGDTYLVNFQAEFVAGVPVPTPNRYLSDTGLVFGDRGGGLAYGWSSDHSTVSRDRGVNPDQRLDTLIHFHAGQNWEFALPNGQYDVTVSIGDPSFPSTYTLNVEGLDYWTAVPLAANSFLNATHQVTVSDGRLTLNQGAAAEMATRINYVHIVGLPVSPNAAPAVPTITEPHVDGQEVHPGDVHMESVGYVDADGNAHKSTDWEIWTVGPGAEPVWQTLGIEGVERMHTHMGDGIFINSHAGRTDLISNPVQNFEFNTYTINLPGVSAGDNLTITAEMINAIGGGGSDISGMVDAFTLLSPINQSLLADGSFELATPGTQTSNSSWVMTAPSDGIEPSAQFQADPWAASAGNTGVWFKGFRGSPGEPVDAQVSQVVTAPMSGDYKLSFSAKVEANFASVIEGFRVTISSDGTGGTETIDLLDTSPREYELRVRYRDDTGSVSGYATRRFTVAPASTIFPMELQDIVAAPAPTWIRSSGGAVTFPPASPNPSQLRLESADGQLLWSLTGGAATNPPALADHAQLRVVVVAGSNGLSLETSELSFHDDSGLQRNVVLPEINLAANGRLDLWVSVEGSTYYGTAAQTAPDFSVIARSANLPFVALQPGYEIDVVASGLRLPVNIAFVPDPGPNPDDPLYYVTELYGSIQVVRRDGTRQTFATSLLDYNPEGPFGGTGEQGLTGLAVERDPADPEIYHLYVGMLWDNGAPPGPNFHYPKVERITSVAGGLAMASRTVLLNMQPETQGQSHQISNISIGPDNKLYVHMGDGFNYTTAQNLDQFRGKVLRMNLDGSAPSDNPFYNAANGINARDYVFAYGLRNPFGGAWRAADGKHYEVENGPSVDRLAQINRGVNYGWNDTDASMTINAIYNWTTAHAPVNLAFIQPETFQGSQFPAGKMDHLFVSESGSTYAAGPQTTGKQVVEFVLDAAGNRLSGPTNLVQYSGTGRGSVVGLAAGPDGLYFTELYEDSGANGPTAPGARIFRVRYVNPLAGDYNIDGIVSEADYGVWKSNYGSNLFLAADGNHDGAVNAADYTIWRNNLGASAPAAAADSASSVSADVAPTSIQDLALADWTPVDSSLTVARIVEQFPDRRVGVQHVDQQVALLSVVDSLRPLRTRPIAASHDADAPSPTHGLPSNGATHAQRHQQADELSALGFCLGPGIKLAFPANLP
jgi:glucose/arabinose dehydrogenase